MLSIETKSCRNLLISGCFLKFLSVINVSHSIQPLQNKSVDKGSDMLSTCRLWSEKGKYFTCIFHPKRRRRKSNISEATRLFIKCYIHVLVHIEYCQRYSTPGGYKVLMSDSDIEQSSQLRVFSFYTTKGR